MKKWLSGVLFAALLAAICCGSGLAENESAMVLVDGGTYTIGSPEDEPWRSEDEMQHEVTLGSFYVGAYEVTQAEYEATMDANPSTFRSPNNPVEGVTWLEAITYCNARSIAEGLTPAYVVDGSNVTWNRAADGYRLLTEAEWEAACRAGTATPFNTQTSISVEEANYWGHYPYMIEENYFSQENLDTRPGIYREETLPVGSFAPNAWGLYDMHGNVGEWVWDRYGAYDPGNTVDPVGASEGARRVYRGGAWNDFAKNLRSAYRAAMQPNLASATIGFRLARNATAMEGRITSADASTKPQESGRVLIAYFSWGGNTRGIAEEIQRRTGFDLFEIVCSTPYSDDYETVLDQAQADQNVQARPELAAQVENMAQYDTILLGYPNWWASIPMPVATFLESYDFSGKTIVPFCSHGGGRFGQSLTAIAKLAPDATLLQGLAVEYSGGSGRSDDITRWLHDSGIPTE